MLGDSTERGRSHCPNIASTVFMPSVVAYPHFHDLDRYREELKNYSEAEVIFQARVAFAIPNKGWHIRECGASPPSTITSPISPPRTKSGIRFWELSATFPIMWTS